MIQPSQQATGGSGLVGFARAAPEGADLSDRLLPLHALIRRQIERSPDTTALIFQSREFSYAELGFAAEAMARRLLAAGLKPEDRVALYLERGPQLLVALLGVLEAGGAYVPLDPRHPAERIGYVLADSEPAFLLTQPSLREQLPATAIPILTLDTGQDALQSQRSVGTGMASAAVPAVPAVPALPDVRPDALAYVIYTSGSTGRPKGAMIEHRSLVNCLLSMSCEPGIDASDVLLAVTTLSFDIAGLELFLPLLRGARIVLATSEQASDGASLCRLIETHGVTVLQATPATWRLLLESGYAGSHRLRALCGGEALPADLARRLRPRVAELWNLYGPTETTIWSTLARIDSDPAGGSVSIGRPIAQTQVHLLDDNGCPVAAGCIGEIHIGGAGVARGYWRREALTAERFIVDRFATEANARLYRTGDLGRWREDGTLDYLGRNDAQIKLRGFRVEPGEIESRLSECPGVREAVVVAREDTPATQRLIAYLVTHPGAAPTARRLRSQLARTLPVYMLPAAYVILPALPLTPNGKIDRRALPAPDPGAMAAAEFQAPEGEIEHILATLWQDLLRVQPVGRNDHFFELGGHSLLCVQLIARVRARLGVELSAASVFGAPLLRQLAQAVQQAQRSVRPALLPRTGTQSVPLSWAQERLWVLEQLDATAASAHALTSGWRLEGALEVGALEWALDRLIVRHEALRTCFVSEDGRPLQRVLPASGARCAFSEEDLRGYAPEPGLSDELVRRCRQVLRRGFDLVNGPLIRAHLFRLADEEHVLLIVQHHIVSDAWSCALLVEELSALYTARRQKRGDPLPPLQVQYPDYSIWQRQHQGPEALQPEIDYWKERLAGAPALIELPTDRPRPDRQSFAGGAVPLHLPITLTDSLRALGERHGTTLFMTLLAGWATLLSRLSAQPDLVIGVPVANRPSPELEPLMGFFVNALALRFQLQDDPTVSELLLSTRKHALDAFAHEALPFSQLVEALRPPRSLSHNPVFQVMLTLDNAPGERGLRFDGLNSEAYEPPRGAAQFDLVLALRDDGTHLRGSIDYACDLFDQASVERLAAQLEVLLAAMARDERQHVSRLPLLSESERRRVIEQWNDTAVRFPSGTLPQLIAAQAARTPAATAVIDGTRRMSYLELERASDGWAARLQEHGVGRGSVVGVALPRSLDTIATALGILKAGGIYLPLDPAYPALRIGYQLRDASAALLITDAHTNAQLGALETGLPRLLIEEAPAAARPARVPLTGSDTAYIIYTSGSTGTPKGVAVSHASAVNLAFARQHGHDPIGPGDRVLAAVSVGFDVSIGQLLLPLISGASIVVAPSLSEISGDEFWSLLVDQGITHINSVPSFFESVLDASVRHRGTQLRRLMLGGEPLSGHLCRRLQAALPGTEIYNMYGPTEACIDATAWRVPEEVDAADSTLPIGRPLANYRAYVLDALRQPLPVGVPGELYIGGAGVAQGYVGQPQLTAQRFLPDPFGPAGSRLYRTGDVAVWRSDGNLQFIGRRDAQIKIRGMRVELGEIEAALCAHPQVARAAVAAHEDAGGRRLVAYLVARQPVPSTELQELLAQRLPPHMIPGAFMFLDDLPLTANGKLDRRALPAPDPSPDSQGNFALPVGETEARLCAIWQRMLKLPRVGRHDHFFDLGGHSLLALQALSAIRQEFHTPVPMTWLFEAPTPARFAALLSRASAPGHAAAPQHQQHLVPMREGGSRPPLFCLNGFDGHVEDYLHLARFLDASIPVYGLETRSAGGAAEFRRAMTSRLTAYEREIRQVQPEGPYRLCGFSFGGGEAFELACRLAESGADVQLILINAYRPTRWLTVLSWGPRGLNALRSGAMVSILRRKLEKLWSHEIYRLRTGEDRDLRQALFREARRRKYRPFAGRALLIKAEGEDDWGSALQLDGCNGWRKFLTGSREVITLPGDHGSIMKEPAVHALVQCLDRTLMN